MGHRRQDLPLSFNAVLAKRAFNFIIVSASGSASLLARLHLNKTLASKCGECLGKKSALVIYLLIPYGGHRRLMSNTHYKMHTDPTRQNLVLGLKLK